MDGRRSESSEAASERTSAACWDSCIGSAEASQVAGLARIFRQMIELVLALRARNGAPVSTRAFGSFASGRSGNGACRTGRRACHPRAACSGLARAGRGSCLGSRDCLACPVPHLEDRRQQVEVRDDSVDGRSGRDHARPAHEERHADRVVKHVGAVALSSLRPARRRCLCARARAGRSCSRGRS